MSSVMVGGEKYHWVGGQLVQDDALRIAEKVAEFDGNLKIQYLEEAASIGDPPFRVVETCRDGVERTVLYAWQLDDRLIERLYEADTYARDVQAGIDAQNERVRADNERRYQERLDEVNAIAKSILKSDKESYVIQDGSRLITVHQNKPAEVEERG